MACWVLLLCRHFSINNCLCSYFSSVVELEKMFEEKGVNFTELENAELDQL